MNSLFVSIPKWLQSLFSNFVWSIATDKKEIFLTFDDGPTEKVTDWVIDTLNEYQAKATFFCIGKNITENPEIFKRILKNGHSVGNHTYNHLKGWRVSKEAYIENILKAEEELLKYKLKNSSKLFRPPYGKIKSAQVKFLKEKKYEIVMWDVLSLDFDTTVKPKKCLDHVLNNSGKGSVIVFHDSLKAAHNMKYVLPKVLKYFSEKGYVFKSIP